MSITMTMLILSQRITRGVTTLIRPRRREPAELNVLPAPCTGLSHIDVDAMRRMW